MNDQEQKSGDTGQFISCLVLLILATLFLSPAILVMWPFMGLEEAWRASLNEPLALIGSYFFWLTMLFIWAHQKDK